MSAIQSRAGSIPAVSRAGAALRKNNLNTIRLVLAATVMVFHVLVLPDIAEFTAVGRHIPSLLGVQGFFVVSGFLVTMSYEATNSLRDYALKRARRILPAYVGVVLISAVGLSALSTLSVAAYFTDVAFWKHVASNLLFMNFLAPDLPGVFGNHLSSAVDGSLWTIKIEVVFYCMVPFIVYFARRWGPMRVLSVLFVASIAWRIGFELVSQRTGIPFYGKLAIQAPGQLSFFVVGALFYYLLKEGQRPPSAWMAAVAVLAYIVAPGAAFHVVAPISVGLVICWAGFRLTNVPDLGAKGDFSYGLYLYHWPVVQVLIALGLFSAAPLVGVATAIALSFSAAVFSWFVVERRFVQTPNRRAH
jgi:peptidoglycan/LPS O-acetylase OafA/YrhL